MIVAWRLTKARWATSCFSGIGAAEDPGRWNSLGRKAVYCGESRALAAMEILVHVEGDKSILAKARFLAFPVAIDETLIWKPEQLPVHWKALPARPATRLFGDRFLDAGKFPVMRVPSAVVLSEFNYVLNPLHPKFARLEIGKPESFRFDPRALD
jgi:RES domain-containing protein